MPGSINVLQRRHVCRRHDRQTRGEYTRWRLVHAGRGSVLAHKLDAERLAAAPNDFAVLAHNRMRYGRKSQLISDGDADLGHELGAVQRHIQDLAFVTDKVIIQHDPGGVLPCSSRFAFVPCNKHQNALAW
jgi:hypothetical protein